MAFNFCNRLLECTYACGSWLPIIVYMQGRLEKLRGPGQRVKVGPQGKEVSILKHNFTQAVS